MYIPAMYRIEDRAELVAFMRAHSFGTLVSLVNGELFATHLPFTIHAPDNDAPLVLGGHLAKANPQAHALEAGEVLVIFQGPHAYISPAHYEKQESVPTWNYTAVHFYGRAKLVSDDAGKLASLAALIAATEPAYQSQWDGLSPRYQQGMLQGMVAFAIEATRVEGKYKLSQNRSQSEQARIATALSNSPDTTTAETGALMARNLG
ncbi:MAG: FMN-binding negative transcriptional regulator [Caldilineaceae bacterium]|nr:FMN-binding negative transcriptional regulator [Caldilineaceae bacterium]